jgi:hypothetical protein
MEWLPIEMAPTDGQRVLLYIPGLPIQVGYFEDREIRRHGKVIELAKLWVWERPLLEVSYNRPGTKGPTHWMPLPEPPNP